MKKWIHQNHLGQPIGFPIDKWQECPLPPQTSMIGRYCRVEPLDPDAHAPDLYSAYQEDQEHRIWTYLGYGPFYSLDAFLAWLKQDCTQNDPLFHTILDLQSNQAVGMASYLRIEPKCGVIEVGHINYSPKLQKTPIATEAMFLMMQRVFDELDYRRYEWKCDSLNAGSRKAATRYGFTFEGIFRQATLYKNRNRDTAWYSIIDTEWPAIKAVFQQWLDAENFDKHGQQKQRLSALMQQIRKNPEPSSAPN